jgi:putative spermidine/putrescine transport system substrate-binding protein
MTCAGKRMLRLRLALAALLLAAAAPAVAAESRTLTVVTWGGAYEASQRAAIFEPFTAATGIEVAIARYDGGVAPLRAHLAQDGAPTWDVVDMIRADARTACRAGLLEPFDPAILAPGADGTPAAADFIDGAFGDCFVTQLVFATVIAYDDRAFPGEKPRSVADFFDLERFPGKRALRAAPVGLFDWALRSYGVPRSQIYDLLSTERGFRLAFRRLDRIRDQLVWWRAGSEPVDLLRSGAVAMATGYNGRFFQAQAVEGAPISVIWDSALLEHNTWAIPKGTPDRDLAEQFIGFATSSERLGAMANRISYGPARRSAQRRIGLHVETGIPMRAHMPTAPRHLAQALHKDDEWYARTADLRRRRFDAWFAQHFGPARADQ